MRRRDFVGPGDLRAMQDMCSRLWSPASRFHPGQLAWSRYHAPVDPRLGHGEAISLWQDDAGRVVGFGWAEAEDWLELQVDPARPEVAEEILDWFEEWSDAPTQSVMLMQGDPAEPACEAAGFAPEVSSAPFFRHHVLDLRELGPVPTVEGYRLRPVEPNEAGARAGCHATAWSDFGPSRVTAQSYQALMAAWPYRADLDWVAVDENGQMVASALVWLDPSTGVGLVEPVGCVPEHRGRGLAAAVTSAALHALAGAGGRTAMVTPRGDDAYPGPMRLYRSLGFRPGHRTVTWTRSLE